MKHDVRTELLYDGGWQDITAGPGPYARDDITVSCPRGDELGDPVSTLATMTLDNRDGSKDPKNPTSPLHGLAGRNTPLRLSIRLAQDAFGRSVSNGWGTADVGGAWTTSGGSASDYSTTGTRGRHSVGAVGSARSTLIGADLVDVDITVNAVVGVLATGASITFGVAARRVDGSNFYLARVSCNTDQSVSLTILKVIGGVQTTLATAAHPTETHTIGDVFSLRFQVAGSALRAKVLGSAPDPVPNGWMVEVTDTDLTAGAVACRSALTTGNTNTLPVLIDYDNFAARDPRFEGEVASWKPRHSLRFNRAAGTGDAWTEVEANGVLRRLSQGKSPVQSALFRAHMADPTTRAYWPLEDAGNANLLASAILGVPDGTLRTSGSSVIRPMQWTDSSLVSSGTLPLLESELGVAGFRFASPNVTAAPALAQSFWTRTGATKKGANAIFTQASSNLRMVGGTEVSATLLQWPEDSSGAGGTENTVSVRASTIDAAGFPIDTVTFDGVFVDDWRHVAVRYATSGSDLAVVLYLDGVQVQTGTLPSAALGRVVHASLGIFTQNTGSEEIGRVSGGHPAILAGTTSDLAAAVARIHTAGRAHVGETAAARLARLFAEARLAFSLIGDSAESMPMGPQPVASLPALLYECERTDAGILFEPRYAFGGAYRTGRSLYNQTPALTLDYNAGHIAPPLEPDVDDLLVRNDVRVTRGNGGEARSVQETGPLNVAPPPDGVGRYDTQVEANPFSDAVLPALAGWYRHRGTIDETRYPRITVDLDGNPGLANAAGAVKVGDVIALDNVPDRPDRIAALVLGFTELLGSHRRKITFITVPAEAHRIAEVTHADYGILGSDSTTLNEALDTTETGVDIACGAGPDWVDEGDVDIVIGGERMTVTAVGAASGTFPNRTQTLTVTRSVNGVVKSHETGGPVELFHQSAIGL